MTERKTFTDDERLEAALAWHVRLAGDVQPADWEGFTLWLEEDPAHRDAFDRADALAAEIASHRIALSNFEAASADAPTIVSLKDFVRPAPSRWLASRRTWLSGVAAAAAVLLAVFLRPAPVAPPVENWSTRMGETREVHLADGSDVHLNTDTVVSFSMDKDTRTVRLEKGEALFDVMADAGRPFVVVMGEQRVQVVGTSFNILKQDGRVAVTVVHGVVQMSRNVDPEHVRLTAGDQFTRRDGEAAYTLVKVDPASVVAWRDGSLVFQDAALADVVSSLNRYFPRQVAINDESVRTLRFSGVLKIDDEMSVLRRLGAFLPVAVQEQGNALVLERR